MENFDYEEDCACLREYSFDVEGEQLYWELDLEYGFDE